MIAMAKALEHADKENEGMEVDGSSERTAALGKLFVPSQKEVEEYLVQRRKQAIMERYVNEYLVQSS